MKNEEFMKNRADSILNSKSYSFAVHIVKLTQYLQKEKLEYVLSKQILRSGTAIGALVRESEFGQSKADFANKLSIALKEANETDYWLSLLKDTDYINEKLFESLQSDCNQLISILISSIKTIKSKL
ncbi:MAG: four helix bundle protein [Dysgonamonadaceae bacterium]|jgi:four helix bundle protein|nr:four helix bundle protein [Dysgonamonadaceae bacterium]